MRVGILYHPKGNPKGNQPWIFNWKDWCWSSNTLATWCQELTHWKRPWCWELRAGGGGEGNDRGWDGWMASSTQWTWVWVSSGSWWWTGKPGMLQSVGLQSDMTEQLNWTEVFDRGVFVILRALLNSDQPHFKCSVDACAPWLPYQPEKHGKV